MCGRTACTLSKENLQKACCRYDKNAKNFKKLEWHDVPNGGKSYQPSYNVCPTDVTPVLVNSAGQRVMMPMLWGMIPPWHKGKYNNHKLSTNNCRMESILESRLYKPAMVSGKRCVVVCDGFYEWQTTQGKGARQPYFVFAPQPDGVRIDRAETWPDSWDPDVGWAGPKLLHMAALYNVWTSPEGEEFWSYAVVTMESDEKFNWLHHRVPAILDSEASVAGWLDDGLVNAPDVIARLRPDRPLAWHPVSSNVNNARDKTHGLNRAVDLSEAKKKLTKSAAMLESWLREGGKTKRNSDQAELDKDSDQTRAKSVKSEAKRNSDQAELDKDSDQTRAKSVKSEAKRNSDQAELDKDSDQTKAKSVKKSVWEENVCSSSVSGVGACAQMAE